MENKKNTFAGKVLWLVGFMAAFLICYTALDFIWKELITSKGYTFDAVKLPGQIVDAFLIGGMIMYISNRKKKSETEAA
jgi:hypothetical protein